MFNLLIITKVKGFYLKKRSISCQIIFVNYFFFSQKFISSGSSLNPEYSNNGSKKLRAGDDTSEREKCKSDLICKDNDGQGSFQSYNHSDDQQFKSFLHRP